MIRPKTSSRASADLADGCGGAIERLSVERNPDLVLAFNEAVFNGHDVSAVDRFMAG